MNFTPLRDLATSMLHRSKQLCRYAMTRSDRRYCEGYEKACNDFILGISEVQKTYTWEYKIRKPTEDI